MRHIAEGCRSCWAAITGGRRTRQVVPVPSREELLDQRVAALSPRLSDSEKYLASSFRVPLGQRERFTASFEARSVHYADPTQYPPELTETKVATLPTHERAVSRHATIVPTTPERITESAQRTVSTHTPIVVTPESAAALTEAEVQPRQLDIKFSVKHLHPGTHYTTDEERQKLNQFIKAVGMYLADCHFKRGALAPEESVRITEFYPLPSISAPVGVNPKDYMYVSYRAQSGEIYQPFVLRWIEENQVGVLYEQEYKTHFEHIQGERNASLIEVVIDVVRKSIVTQLYSSSVQRSAQRGAVQRPHGKIQVNSPGVLKPYDDVYPACRPQTTGGIAGFVGWGRQYRLPARPATADEIKQSKDSSGADHPFAFPLNRS